MNHTSGPWRAWPNKDRTFAILAGANSKAEDVVARINGGFEKSYRANAHLIAAAPELLEILKDCVNGLGCQPGYVKGLTLDRAQSIIAKAEGRA